MKKNKLPLALITALLVALVTACGGGDNTGVMAPVVVENTIAPEKTEEPVKEVDPDATYAEYNELEFTKNTAITTKGILYVGTDVSTLEVIDVDWKITNITISEAEDGIQTIVIEQESHGYIEVDDTGNIFATNLNMPVGRLCDCFTGIMIPVDKIEDESETKADTEIESVDITESKIEWKDKTYTISATESVIWEDADWATGWIEAPSDKGEILPSTLKVRTEITVTEGYEGLALVLVPITDADGSVYGKRIMDAWTEGSYIFNVSELSSKFEDVEEDENSPEMETTATPAPTEIHTPTEKPAVEEEKPAETTEKPVESPKPAVSTPQPMHVHQYSSTVISQPTCTTAGVKSFTCTNCGDTYTESMGTISHDYSVPVTHTVHHDEQYEAVRREIPAYKVIICRCGEKFTTQADYETHCAETFEKYENILEAPCGGRYNVEEHPASYTYDYVLVTPAYDSEEIVGYKCSVCGTTK